MDAFKELCRNVNVSVNLRKEELILLRAKERALLQALHETRVKIEAREKELSTIATLPARIERGKP